MHLRVYLLHVPIYICLYTCMYMTSGKSSQGSQQRTDNTRSATTRLQNWSLVLLKYKQLYNWCSLHSTIILQNKDITKNWVNSTLHTHRESQSDVIFYLGKGLRKCHKICIKKTEILRSKQLHVELTCIFQSDTPPFTQPLHQFVYKSQRQKWLQAAENKMCHRLNIKLYLKTNLFNIIFQRFV